MTFLLTKTVSAHLKIQCCRSRGSGRRLFFYRRPGSALIHDVVDLCRLNVPRGIRPRCQRLKMRPAADDFRSSLSRRSSVNRLPFRFDRKVNRAKRRAKYPAKRGTLAQAHAKAGEKYQKAQFCIIPILRLRANAAKRLCFTGEHFRCRTRQAAPQLRQIALRAMC
jgi:hypothetical protein